MRPLHLPLLVCAVLLAGCELLGDSPEKIAAAKEADGMAIGSACRHAGRAIEDCYLLNPKARRASVFAGWREMDEYMRENKLDAVPPVLGKPVGQAPESEVAATLESAEPDGPKPSAKGKPHSS